jgi:hypothetical protein
MTTPTPQIRPDGTYPDTYTVFCTADTKFFNETPPPPLLFFFFTIFCFFFTKSQLRIQMQTPGGYIFLKKSKTYNKKVHEISIKRSYVAPQQLCDILHKRFQNGTPQLKEKPCSISLRQLSSSKSYQSVFKK